MKAKFKISQLAAVDKVTKELVHPKRGPTGIEVTVAGPMHPAWRDALKVFATTDIDDENRGKALFGAAVLGWDEEAMEAPFTPESVKAIFSDKSQEWFAEWVVTQTQDHSQFFL